MKCDETCTRRSFLRTTGIVAATAGITLAASGLPKFATSAAAATARTRSGGLQEAGPGRGGEDRLRQLHGSLLRRHGAQGDLRPAREIRRRALQDLPGRVHEVGARRGCRVGHGLREPGAGGTRPSANIVGDTDTAEAMTNDLMFYYANTVLPIFKPAKGTWAEIKDTTKADDSRCATSRSAAGWPRNGSRVPTNERAERCARVAASVALKRPKCSTPGKLPAASTRR